MKKFPGQSDNHCSVITQETTRFHKPTGAKPLTLGEEEREGKEIGLKINTFFNLDCTENERQKSVTQSCQQMDRSIEKTRKNGPRRLKKIN